MRSILQYHMKTPVLELQVFRPATLLKRLQHGCFSVNIAKFLRAVFDHLRWNNLTLLRNNPSAKFCLYYFWIFSLNYIYIYIFWKLQYFFLWNWKIKTKFEMHVIVGKLLSVSLTGKAKRFSGRSRLFTAHWPVIGT